MYGSDDAAGKHTAGSVEDSIIARLMDSLRPTKPDLIEHLDILILYLAGLLGRNLANRQNPRL